MACMRHSFYLRNKDTNNDAFTFLTLSTRPALYSYYALNMAAQLNLSLHYSTS